MTIVIGTAVSIYLLTYLPNSTLKALTSSSSPSPSPSPMRTATAAPAIKAGPKKIDRNGDIGFIRAGKEANVLLATSEKAYDRFIRLATSKDNLGISQMVLQNEMFTVPTGTKCRMIDAGLFVSEVRIEEGGQLGRSGFIAAEWVVSE